MTRTFAVVFVTACLCASTQAQMTKRSPAPAPSFIKAGRLIDTKAGTVSEKQGIIIVGGRIQAVGPLAEMEGKAPAGAKVIDLSGKTVLPGLSDCHTHVLLQGDITNEEYDEQILKESTPYRAIRATAAVRTSLMNGFTAIRDLETEGAMYADVDVKRAIARGVIPGPRMWCATRAFAPTGMYPVMGYSWELKMPEGVQIIDGPDAIRKAVREQVKYGADLIKFYCDRRYYMKDGALHSWVNFTDEEMAAMIGEAHRLGKPVAAHAMGKEGIDAALRHGADTIEHGDGLDEELMDRMVKQGTFWCPTIYVGVWVMEGRGQLWKDMADVEAKAFAKAVKKGVKIAYGTDVGGYPWTENQAKELDYMVKYGMTTMQAVQSATTVAADLLKTTDTMGVIAPGMYADIIAVDKDPLADITELQRVTFVMKGGEVYKGDK